jgi:predicted transcriptional regulator
MTFSKSGALLAFDVFDVLRRGKRRMAVETSLTELTVLIVACYVSNNPLMANEIPAVISSTHAALLQINSGPANSKAPPEPVVSVEEAITRDYLICLNDGKKLRALKRYLQKKYSLSPEQYRKKWGLPDDYPMVAPAYSELRAKIARKRVKTSSN